MKGKSCAFTKNINLNLDKALRDFEERIKNDVEFKMLQEEAMRRYMEQKLKENKPPTRITTEIKKTTEE